MTKLIALAIILLLTLSPVSAAKAKCAVPCVIGSIGFTISVNNSLALLKDRDAADYAYVADGYVRNIIEWNGGYSYTDLYPGWCNIYLGTGQLRNPSDLYFWIAGIIVHERTHCWDDAHHIDPYDEKPPLLRQVAALRAMGTPSYMTDYVASFIK